MSERKPALVLGYFVGTCTGWDQGGDWQILLYDFEPYEGFDMPTTSALGIDYEDGNFEIYDEEGNVSISKDIVSVMDAFVSSLPESED